jgi:hypothetical protein
MKKLLLSLPAAGVALSTSYAALVYQDEFEDGDPAANTYAGNILQDNNGNPITETDGSAHWGIDGGWNWGGANIQTNEDFVFPVPGKKYTIEWKVGPLEVTTPSDQSWGDLRMQLNLLSKNSGQGQTPSAEFWSLTAGGLGVDIAYKGGVTCYANLVAKNDAQPAASNPTNATTQNGHQIDVTQNNVFTIELTNTDVTLSINGNVTATQPLFLWGLGAGVGEEFENGFFLSTRGARVNTGRGTMSVQSVTVDLSDVELPPPPPIPTLRVAPATPGLKLITAAGQYGRQNLRTTNPEYSWVGATQPVTYSVTIAEYPEPQYYQTNIYLVPGSGLATGYNSPDWSAPVVALAYINNNANGTAGMRFAYKNHTTDSNGLTGHDYWTNDNGELYENAEGPGPDGTGKGGTLAFVNSATVLGTWSLTFHPDDSVVLTAPDGQTATGTIPPATAALFANPLYAYFGTVPNQIANIGLGATFSRISITGVANPINEDFADPVDPAVLEYSASDPNTIFHIVPGQNPFWAIWSLPDSGFKLQQSSDLKAPWQDYPAADAIIAQGEKHKLLSSSVLLNPQTNFLRLHKPN